MKAYRFKAVYNDSPLFEFQISESSNLDFLAQNLCESIQVEYDKTNVYMYTKKKGRVWDTKSRIHNDGFNDELKSIQFRVGKKLFIIFDEDSAEGIEIQCLSKNNDLKNEFEVVSKPKKLTVAQLNKLSLKSHGNVKKTQSQKSKKSDNQVTVLEEPEEDDFIENEMSDEDSLHLTDADFDRDYVEEDDDLDESGIFDAEEIESIDDDLDDALDIDDDDDYIDEDDDFYDDDDEDYIDKFDSDDDDDDDDYYSDYDDDDDDDDDYYDDDFDEDDDDKY